MQRLCINEDHEFGKKCGLQCNIMLTQYFSISPTRQFRTDSALMENASTVIQYSLFLYISIQEGLGLCIRWKNELVQFL